MNQIEHDNGVLSHEQAPPALDGLLFVRYTSWVAVLVGSAALLAMLFVALVDPYHVFGIVDVAGFNRVKPLPAQYREQIKLAQAIDLQPNAMLFGNSRIEVGFDPASPQLHSRGWSAYNLALAGTNLSVSRKIFTGVRSGSAPPKLALIGVEFLDFLVDPAARTPSFNADAQWSSWQWRIDTLFSMKALADAAQTLRLQTNPDPDTMTAQGQTPLFEYRKFARQEGYHMIFQQRAQENAKNVVRKPHSLHDADGSSASIDSLRRMLATMANDGTEVHLVIYPYHAQFMAMFDEAGLSGTMEQWKSLLVQEVAAATRQHPGARIRLWDFSGFESVQCEIIPALGDTTSTTRFYWEGGHFKSSVGELILQRIFGQPGPIGLELTAANLDSNRQRIAAERSHCAAVQPAVFEAARSLVHRARAATARKD